MTDYTETIKVCPICGNVPMGMVYTSNPPQYGYSHCGIDGGYCQSESEAVKKWNEQVYLYTHQENDNKFLDELMMALVCRMPSDTVCSSAYNLIKRLKAENERLKHYKQLYKDLKAEHLETIKAIKQAESEAIREFWTKVKEEKITHRNLGEIIYVEIGDVLLKEMVGDSDA